MMSSCFLTIRWSSQFIPVGYRNREENPIYVLKNVAKKNILIDH